MCAVASPIRVCNAARQQRPNVDDGGALDGARRGEVHHTAGDGAVGQLTLAQPVLQLRWRVGGQALSEGVGTTL